MRIGNGVDVHAFSDDPNRLLVLGGVQIPGAQGLDGHSDADVVLHAIVDALLGAAALGDLGSLVGIDRPETHGASSASFVRAALDELAAAGFTIGNVDATVVAQTPRLSGVIAQMRDSVAHLLRVPTTQVSIKATTTDRLGAIGNNEGIACLAVVLIV
ncbi:2-C-methyl-D-erythritol 2,4-cyclodiphosphate synthase [Stomatohabitans albus]|uniref:2-C-methyl-D-erythritol 2,4-cyclodiphosphate synthase n=1 Tax=Stomatohabitans albus TaxID=3110766 RepID=UPI00300D6379